MKKRIANNFSDYVDEFHELSLKFAENSVTYSMHDEGGYIDTSAENELGHHLRYIMAYVDRHPQLLDAKSLTALLRSVINISGGMGLYRGRLRRFDGEEGEEISPLGLIALLLLGKIRDALHLAGREHLETLKSVPADVLRHEIELFHLDAEGGVRPVRSTLLGFLTKEIVSGM